MDRNKSRLGGFLSYFYGNFIVLLLGFIQTPLVTRIMSTDEYGRTGMFETAVSCIYIFAILGLDQAYIRYFYKKGTDRRKLMRSCLLPPLAIVSGLILLYFFMSTSVNNWLFGRNGVDITLLVAGYTLISVFERFLFLEVRMEQNGRLYSNVNIAQKALNILLIFIFFSVLGNDFRVVLYSMTFSWGTTTAFIGLRFLFKRKEGLQEDGTEDNVEYPTKELISYGLPFILVLLMEWLLSSCDRIALKQWSDYNELGIYSAAMKIMVLLLTFKNTFLAYWSPVAMEKYENDDGSARAFFKTAFDLVRYLCILMAVGMILFKDIIVLLLGSAYRGADRIIPFLTLMPIYAMMFEITVQGIKFMKKNMYLNLASAAAIIANICGNCILVPYFGGRGAALTTGCSYLIYFAAGSFFAEKVYPVGYRYLRTFAETLLMVLMAFIASFTEYRWLTFIYGLLLILLVSFIERESFKMCVSKAEEIIKLCKRKLQG